MNIDTIQNKHVITEKDSIIINGKKYLYIRMELIEDPLNMFDKLLFNNEIIIKGIGSLSFMTGNIWSPIEVDLYGPLRCYSDSAITYTTDVPCDAIITQNKPGKDIAEEISFLQTNNQLTIIMPDNAVHKYSLLQIYDIQGRIVISEKLQNAVTEMPFQDLYPGIYIANIVIENERIFTRKMSIK